ncbi:helix-turn-helix domain-containing protein [Frigoribacterium sp. CFBP 8759]|uniref:helix-turn-helix transcriptional regulator n=1 Tax=Frigoribacterium sp. CFBP 8759 TaxID=2775283 RepID=UPI00177BEE16|nr:helix-turn-helix transcriptional regulator [Frigoribacterium sp. CFBP 8759]MBD8486249.1 helix-turn-helix domain-containing protein [Frigoribacterium sp. CFBP 8759]
MSEFADVLRSWRDRVGPADVGLPAGVGRRTTGLRREELAALAGVSVDYVVRLEQGRATNPSPQMLRALAVALRLSDDERDHLYRSAGAAPPSAGIVPRHVGPGVQRIVDRLGDVPLAVFSATHDILLWNPLWAAVNGDPSRLVGLERNLVWRHFTSGHEGTEFDARHEEDFASDLAADLRAAVGRYPSDPSLGHLVSRLLETSPEFARRWAEAKVAEHRASRKTVTGTPVGPIAIDCDVLTAPGDLRIVVYTVAPGSDDEARLDLLRVTGLQSMAATSAG